MALALYRKYRPATFAEVVGQEHVTEPLRKALAAGRINHAYLFSGPRGCGKTSSARILARSLNCAEGPTPDPCGVCASCVALAPEGPGSLDVIELDAASHGGVNDTRELRDRAFYMPAESRYRVFIIDEAHMVTKEGFNALLKIVEEPPEHLVFVFATTEPEKVLPTIRSRTHHYPFHLLPPAILRGLLERLCGEEGVAVEPAVYPLVVKAGAGSARDALSVMDQLLAGAGPDGVTYANAVALLGVTDAALLDEMVDALAALDGASVFGAVERVAEAGHDPRRFGADLLQRLRDLVILQAVPDAVAKGLIDAPEDQLVAMVHEAERLPTATLTRFAEILHTGLAEMRGTTSPRLVLELLCARMLLPAASLDDAGLLQRLERVERRLEIAAEHETAKSDASGGGGAAGGGAAAGAGPAVRGGDGARGQASAAKPVPASGSRSGSAGKVSAARHDSAHQPAAARAAGVADLGLPEPPVLSGERTGATDAPARAEGAARSAVGPAVAETREPSAATETVAAPQVSSTDVGVTDVRRVWTEVLAAVKQQRRTTQVLLESATVTAVDGGALVVTMPTAALARRLGEPGNIDVLRAALRDVLGVDWRVRCESGDAGSAASGRSPAPSVREPGGRASAQAAVREADAAPSRAVDRVAAATPKAPSSPSFAAAEGLSDERDEPNPYDDLDPDDDAQPGATSYQAVDPSQAAIELLTSKLGARPIDEVP